MGSHLVVWVAVLVPMVVVLARGWIPSGDDAAIAVRSYQTFSLHPPLLGLVSTVGTGTGHYVSDPGPLLFWLLALPVHIDLLHGPLWGAALIGAIALSVAIEALWSAGQWVACAVVAFAVADYLWFVSPVLENVVWNAYFPIPFFVAAVAVAWVVAGGSLAWWPVLVFAGSVAAQCQLIFFLPAVGLVVAAPVIALAFRGRPGRWRWLAVGALIGAGCWLAPVLQAFGPGSNLSALATSTRGLPRLGSGWGLRVLATAGSPSALWLHHLPTSYYGVLGTIAVNNPVSGALVLGILVAIAAWAWRRSHLRLSALALVAAVCSVALAIGFALVPEKNSLNLSYMIAVLWALSIVIWSTTLWAVVLAGASLAARLRRGDGHPARRLDGRVAAPVVLAAPVVVLVLGILALRSYQPGLVNVGTRASDARVLPEVATQVERAAPGREVVVRVEEAGAPGLVSFWLTEGAAWYLVAAGWHPALDGMARAYTGLAPRPGAPAYLVTIEPRSTSARVRIEPGNRGP